MKSTVSHIIYWLVMAMFNVAGLWIIFSIINSDLMILVKVILTFFSAAYLFILNLGAHALYGDAKNEHERQKEMEHFENELKKFLN